MKKFIMSLLFVLTPVIGYAGIQDGQLIRRGFNYGVYAVVLNSTTPTLVSSFNTKKVDIMTRFTNASYDVLIVTSTFAGIPLAANGGFPVKSGEKLGSDGYFPGEIYMIMQQFSPATTINTIEFYRQEY